jgi:glutathione S-transferase
MLPNRIFHLAVDTDWIAALQSDDGAYRMSTIGRSLEEEGFIHCSFEEQVETTAARFYAGRADVLLLAIDPERVAGPIEVETIPSGEAFPHVYGPIPVHAVVWAAPVPLGPTGVLDVQALLRP